MEQEIWKDIPGYEGKYQASSEGRIRSLDHYSREFINNGTPCRQFRKGKILKGTHDFDGYVGVDLYGDTGGKPKTCQVHRLVAKTSILNPDNLPQIDHLNGIKDNNRVCNLEWVSCTENIHRVWKNGRASNVGKVGKTCKCIDDNCCFVSVKAAASYYSIPSNRIYDGLKNDSVVRSDDGKLYCFEYINKGTQEYDTVLAEFLNSDN